MKKTLRRKMVIFVLIILSVLVFTACSKTAKINVDENGVASWKPVKGAVQYEYEICDVENTTMGTMYTTETSIQLPEGFCVHVRPVMSDGKKKDTMISEYYGEPKNYIELLQNGDLEAPLTEDNSDGFRIEQEFTVLLEDVSIWNIVENIQKDTVKTDTDGTLAFSSKGPDGKLIRFVGTGVKFEEGCLIFEPGSMLTSLDSIGRICYMQHTVFENSDPDNNSFDCSGGYTFSDSVSVESIDDLYFCRASGRYVYDTAPMGTMCTQPNMVHWGASDYNTGTFSLSELTVGYDDAMYSTPIKQIYLNVINGNAKIYFEGQRYDVSKEVFDLDTQQYYFDMVIQPDIKDLDPKSNVE